MAGIRVKVQGQKRLTRKLRRIPVEIREGVLTPSNCGS